MHGFSRVVLLATAVVVWGCVVNGTETPIPDRILVGGSVWTGDAAAPAAEAPAEEAAPAAEAPAEETAPAAEAEAPAEEAAAPSEDDTTDKSE